jgi:hypothetical protein
MDLWNWEPFQNCLLFSDTPCIIVKRNKFNNGWAISIVPVTRKGVVCSQTASRSPTGLMLSFHHGGEGTVCAQTSKGVKMAPFEGGGGGILHLSYHMGGKVAYWNFFLFLLWTYHKPHPWEVSAANSHFQNNSWWITLTIHNPMHDIDNMWHETLEWPKIYWYQKTLE